MQIIDLREQPGQIPLLAAWHHHQWREINPGQTLQQRIERMQAYLRDELVPSTYVAMEQEEVLGSAAIVEYDMRIEGCTPWLASVYVHPEFRRQGIGSALVNHVMEQARAAGIKHLYLFTPNRAQFYQRLGWEVMSEEPYHGQHVTIMKLNLQATML